MRLGPVVADMEGMRPCLDGPEEAKVEIDLIDEEIVILTVPLCVLRPFDPDELLHSQGDMRRAGLVGDKTQEEIVAGSQVPRRGGLRPGTRRVGPAAEQRPWRDRRRPP